MLSAIGILNMRPIQLLQVIFLISLLNKSYSIDDLRDCSDTNVVCFASFENSTAWSMKGGCLKQNRCQVIIKGILSDESISWEFYLSPGAGTAFVSINEHPEPFPPEKDYFFTELIRHPDNIAVTDHKIHTTGPNRDQISDIVCQYEDESEFRRFNESHSCPMKLETYFTTVGSGTSAKFKTKTKLYYEVKYGRLRPYVSFAALPLYIHLKVVRSDAVTELVSSKPFFLFQEKNSNNNADKFIPANQVAPCVDGECNKFDILGIPEKAVSTLPPVSPGSNDSDLKTEDEKSNTTTVIIVVVVVVLLLLTFIGLLFLFLCRNRKPSRMAAKKTSKTNISTASSDLRSDFAMK